MIGTVVFVLVFVTLGLAVVAAAFSGGSRGAGQRSNRPPSRGARRAIAAASGVAIVAFGIAVPALVGVANGEDRAKQAIGGVDLTDRQEHGRQVYARYCATCHTLKASNAVGRVGPNLDVVRPPVEATLSAIEQGRAGGMGQMPVELVVGEDAEAVADYIAAVAGR